MVPLHTLRDTSQQEPCDTNLSAPRHRTLANFVASTHSQGISAARTKLGNFIRKTILIRQRIPSQRLIRSILFEIWYRKFASEFPGASEFAFAFAAVSLRPRCTQIQTCLRGWYQARFFGLIFGHPYQGVTWYGTLENPEDCRFATFKFDANRSSVSHNPP